MITSRNELKEYLRYEKALYPLSIFDILTRNQMYYNLKYVRYLRYCEYFRNRKGWYFLPFVVMRLRKNLLGKKIGVEIGENCCGKGLLIYHNGSIVVNGHSRIGENLHLHGCNCIGNLGMSDESCPIIGDNVSFGVGAIAIGGITIGSNVRIGANATCVSDCRENNVTLIGTPARIVLK